jgi:hypothetical protein
MEGIIAVNIALQSTLHSGKLKGWRRIIIYSSHPTVMGPDGVDEGGGCNWCAPTRCNVKHGSVWKHTAISTLMH